MLYVIPQLGTVTPLSLEAESLIEMVSETRIDCSETAAEG